MILTILVVSLVVTVTVQFNRGMRTDLYGAVNLRDGVSLKYVAKSGFNYGLAVLQADMREDAEEGDRGDSLLEAWADQEAFSEVSAALFSDARFEVRVSDHSGKIQVNNLINDKGERNRAQTELFIRFLQSPEFELDADTARDIAAAVVDWIDKDDETTALESGGMGAETKDYLSLDPPYPCHNEPIEFIEELLLVKGVTRELFYGNGEKPGISEYLSIFGDGKININTAPRLVLKALSEDMTDWMVDNMLKYRQDQNNDLKQLSMKERTVGEAAVDSTLLTTKSSFFGIRSEGIRYNMARAVTGIVERTKDGIQILSWKIE